MSLIKKELSELSFNPFKLIGKDWMLITAGSIEKYNTMTASWGQLGHLWNMDVMTCYIRPNRFTFGFVEENDTFTVSFFRGEYKSALAFCGANSGRDCDKAKEAGLTPVNIGGTVYFEEASIVFVCRKLYAGMMETDSFISDDGLTEKFYSKDPLHKTFTAEITSVYVNE